MDYPTPLDLAILPDRIYKYRSMSGAKTHPDDRSQAENTLAMISHGEIFFSSARRFNDPFDSAVGFDLDQPRLVQQRWLLRVLARERPDMNRRQRRAEAKRTMQNTPADGTETLGVIHQRLQENLYRTFGIFCTSHTEDNLLMWAHYASDHKGIVLKLSKNALQEAALKRMYQRGSIIEAIKVRYRHEMEPYSAFARLDEATKDEYLGAVIGTKSKHWKYEEEYRLITWNEVDCVVECGPSLVEAVILGCRISREDEQDVRRALEESGSTAKLLRASKSQRQFKLDVGSAD